MKATSAESKQMGLVVNGQARSVPEGMNLEQLLGFLEVDPARVAVEMNKVIVRRAAWSTTTVESGSTLEIVQFVGGG